MTLVAPIKVDCIAGEAATHQHCHTDRARLGTLLTNWNISGDAVLWAPAPDYGMSDDYTVTVRMSSAEPDFTFLEMILSHEDRTGRAMPIDSMIILSRLRYERRLTTADLAPTTQKSEQETRSALEKLAEAGLVEAHGSGRGRTYMLSAKIYRTTGQKAAYIRQAGFDPIQQEQMVLKYIDQYGSIKRADVAE